MHSQLCQVQSVEEWVFARLKKWHTAVWHVKWSKERLRIEYCGLIITIVITITCKAPIHPLHGLSGTVQLN